MFSFCAFMFALVSPFAVYPQPRLLPLPQKIKMSGQFIIVDRKLVNEFWLNKQAKAVKQTLEPLLREGGFDEIDDYDGMKEMNTAEESSLNVFVATGALGAEKKWLKNFGLESFSGDKELLSKKEGYALVVGRVKKTGKPFVFIHGADEAGTFYGVMTLRQLMGKSIAGIKLWEAEIVDYPAFAFRGVLEGSYTGPWTHEQRMSILEVMACYKMNYFMYGPKTDPLIRNTWRILYSNEKMKEFEKEIQFAKEYHIHYAFVLSPVTSATYSADTMLDKAMKKLEQFLSLGVRDFGILFDDIMPVINQKDKKVYQTAAHAHVDFTNKLYAAVNKKYTDVRFAFVPVDYSGTKSTWYLEVVKKHLNSEISIGWTGKDIISDVITVADTKLFQKAIGNHAVSLGDNFPVAEGTGGLPCMGPLRDREAGLYKVVNGFIGNGTGDQPEGSKISFMTIADYTWNPENYDAEHSWDKALELFAQNKEALPYLRMFAEEFQFNYPVKVRSSMLQILWDAAWREFVDDGKWGVLYGVLLEQLKDAEKVHEVLEAKLNNPQFIAEMKSTLEKYTIYAKTGISILQEVYAKPVPENKSEREKIRDEATQKFLGALHGK